MTLKKLAIDCGHGFANTKAGVYDPGAEGGGLTEAAVTLEWGLTLKYFCVQAGIPVWMSRNSATDPDPVGTRDDRAEAAGCSHFIAFHLNDSDTASANGTETYYRDDADKKLAGLIQREVCAALTTKDRGLKTEGASQHSRLAVFSFDGPCCLCELGFISNTADRAKLTDRTKRIDTCEMIVAELLHYYNSGE